MALPQFVRDLLSFGPPLAGDGVNLWLFRTARVLHPHRSDVEIADILRTSVVDCGRVVTEQEITRAIERSRDWKPGDGASQGGCWPSLDNKRRGEIMALGSTFDDLCECSPFFLEPGVIYTEKIIDALFPGDPLLCCARRVNLSQTKRKSEWRGTLETMQFIVPNPMTARTGKTQEGKVSARSLTNTGPRSYLVIEQDAGSYDQQAAILLHWANDAPLALAVYSGGKSLHGWFYCAGQAEEKLHQFMRRAVSLGADRATWTRSQLVRMPDGVRDTGARQTVYYFNPEVIR